MKATQTVIKPSLILKNTLPDGKVIAVHSWATGWQELEYPSKESFERAKASLDAPGGEQSK